jgi:hypothetical protein
MPERPGAISAVPMAYPRMGDSVTVLDRHTWWKNMRDDGGEGKQRFDD